jgi:hypothetical protein
MDKQTDKITVSLTAAEHELCRRVADAEGMKLAAWVRREAVRAMKRYNAAPATP